MSHWIATCGCGAVSLEIDGEPRFVNACSCLDCQRASGSAFTYSAFFDKAAVKLRGEVKTWTAKAESGNHLHAAFCPTCGVGVYTELEAVPDMLSIPVGLLGDQNFAPPEDLYWAKRKHGWFEPPAQTVIHETQ